MKSRNTWLCLITKTQCNVSVLIKRQRYCTCSIHSQQILCNHTRPSICGFHQGINGFSKSVLSHTDQTQIQINSVCLLTDSLFLHLLQILLDWDWWAFCLSQTMNTHLIPSCVINYNSVFVHIFLHACQFHCFIVMDAYEGKKCTNKNFYFEPLVAVCRWRRNNNSPTSICLIIYVIWDH